MKLEAFVLCDAATDTMGKLNLLGTFDSIYAQQVPAVHPQCAIAMRIRFERIERGGHKIRLNIVDADGKSVVPPLDANIQIDFPEQRPSHAINLILNMHQLRFEKYGEFSIDLAVDGRQEGSIPLFVAKANA